MKFSEEKREAFNKSFYELLENSFKNINEKDEKGETVLHHAVGISDCKTVKLLIKKGAEVNARDKKGYTPLHCAVFARSLENVKVLIRGGTDVNARDGRRNTALHYASLMGYEETVRELIKAGSNVNIGNEIGRHKAVFMREIGNVRAILEGGGEVNAKDQKGYTPIDLAYMANSEEIMRELVAKQKVMEVD
ncbi:ankyrin repeat domain-containing protein [Wolbachia endosymbiont (group A) of Myopa testacea]|uniref:ankyrin repeat domain-containing protein n=1 Tax=Wolbachia endosymbiont (group A) of Myopa testacea TaxID=3066148 RepID=UPI003342B2D7